MGLYSTTGELYKMCFPFKALAIKKKSDFQLSMVSQCMVNNFVLIAGLRRGKVVFYWPLRCLLPQAN